MLLVSIASSFIIIKELSGISGGILFLAATSALSGGAVCSGSSRNRIYSAAQGLISTAGDPWTLTERRTQYETRNAVAKRGVSHRFVTSLFSSKGSVASSGDRPYTHYSQVKLKTLLSMSNFTHFLPVYPIKIWLHLFLYYWKKTVQDFFEFQGKEK